MGLMRPSSDSIDLFLDDSDAVSRTANMMDKDKKTKVKKYPQAHIGSMMADAKPQTGSLKTMMRNARPPRANIKHMMRDKM